MSHRRKLIIALVVVMLVFMGIWVMTMSFIPDNDVEAYKKSLMAKGEKLEIAEVMPPAVPLEQNGVEVVKEGFGLLTLAGLDSSNQPLAMRLIAPGKAIVGFEQPEVRVDEYTNSWSNVMDVVEADRPATELIKEAMNYPVIDFQIDYEKGYTTLLGHVAPMKRCAQRLSAEALCDLHEGNAGAAATNVCAILGLVNGWQSERYLISQLVRIAMTHIAASASWELLQSTNVNDAELAMLQTNWEKLEFTHAMLNGLLMERALGELEIKKMRQSNGYFNHMVDTWGGRSAGGSGDPWDEVKLTYGKFMWHVSWTYSDELRMLQNDQLILETMRTAETNQFFNPAYDKMATELYGGITNEDLWPSALDLRHMFSASSRDLGGSIHRTMLVEVARRIVITAIALKRYQLKHGDYPVNLDALVPAFLPAVPLDPVDGKALRYRRNTDGTYLLYSIGDNSKDDGGNPALEPGVSGSTYYWLNPHALDWVWPQPATKAEIEYFYAHPPKY